MHSASPIKTLKIRSRSDLYPYQRQAIDFLKGGVGRALWAEMGLGKTVITLTALDDLFEAFECTRALVIAPLRVASIVWSDAVEEWAHLRHLRVSKILGTEKQRLAAINAKADIYAINRENIPWLEEQFIAGKKQVRRWPWDMVVIDESSSFKNHAAKRFKSLRRLRRLFPRLIELTGTPAPRGLEDLWSQIFLLDGGERLGRTLTAFRERWFIPINKGTFTDWVPKKGAREEIEALLKDIVMTIRVDDVLEGLSPVVYQTVKVQLSVPILKAYKKMEHEALLELFSGKEIEAVNAGVLAGKLLQLANGAAYIEAPHYEVFHDEKIEALKELVEAVPSAIIAYNFISDRERIEKALAGLSWSGLNGPEDEKLWRAGKIDYLLLHPASAGHGLNLQREGCNHVIWFGLNWSLELYQQLNARLTGGHRRTGKHIIVQHLVTEGTIDEDVMIALAGREFTQNALLDALRRRL